MALNQTYNESDKKLWLTHLFELLSDSKQRQLLSVRGNQAFQIQWIDLLQTTVANHFFLSNTSNPSAIAIKSASVLLGRETPLVIVDFSDGINIDVFCLAAGLVSAGGLLVTVSSPLSEWDNAKDQFACWQDGQHAEHSFFVQYFFDQMKASTDCLVIEEQLDLPSLKILPDSPMTRIDQGTSPEQSQALERVKSWIESPDEPFVILAGRGRGKSSCLGLIAEWLTQTKNLVCTITASSARSADQALNRSKTLRFKAPDNLLIEPDDCDLLLIDEAASIPFPVLDQLCTRYPRVIMTTTTDGYEGTGQGFLLRFVDRWLPDKTNLVTFNDPIRWGSNDLLEAWLNRVLMLKHSKEGCLTVDNPMQYRWLNSSSLTENIDLLQSIYRLMTSAHYRSRPSDLRQLIENPDLHILVAANGDEVVGVLMLNQEGGLDTDLSEAIFMGNRRPRGHLLAQMITAQAGIRGFSSLRGCRIQRIAVDSSRRRQGIGRKLIQLAEQFSRDQQYDYIGASFAFDKNMADFWQNCQYPLVHISWGKGKSTGNHSVAVLKGWNKTVGDMIQQLEHRIEQSLPMWMTQFLQWIDADSCTALLRYSRYEATLSDLEHDEIEAFTLGNKHLDSCFVAIQRQVMHLVANCEDNVIISNELVHRIIQNRAWHQIEFQNGSEGRRHIENRLRLAVAELNHNLTTDIARVITHDR
jgi:tRNA(Met) cytidine acetyltransferase